MRDVMLPLAEVATPNLPEAEVLTGMRIGDVPTMKEAARRLHGFGCRWVLVKGGHLCGDPVDVLFDGHGFLEVRRPRVPTPNRHGTGCTYSAAIATGLAWGLAVPAAVEWARDAVQAGLQAALDVGRCSGPLGHGALFGRPRPR